jgi:NADH-quinone oxidoreductase subunit N
VRPWLAAAMTVFMMALMGFPIIGGMGFLAKWYVLKAALQSPTPQTALAVILVLTTVISAGYYLYVVMVMFMRPRAAEATVVPATHGWTRFVVVACALAILIIGIAPDYTVRYASVGVPRVGAPTDSTLSTAAAPQHAALR